MAKTFPAIGHKYLVDFVEFKVTLSFASESSLTYAVMNPDGSAGQVEAVQIKVEEIGDQLFLVTWQETDKTTVVHIENYKNNTIVTNITNPNLAFEQHHGTFTLIADNPTVSFANDIRPLFRAKDIACMKPRSVFLDNYDWIRTPANAQRVYDQLSSGNMPLDGAWPSQNVSLFKAWVDGGFKP
jgi:hypothetical protein